MVTVALFVYLKSQEIFILAALTNQCLFPHQTDFPGECDDDVFTAECSGELCFCFIISYVPCSREIA